MRYPQVNITKHREGGSLSPWVATDDWLHSGNHNDGSNIHQTTAAFTITQETTGLASSTVSATLATVKPTGSRDIVLTVVGAYALGVSWEPPAESGGATVSKYLIEWDTDYQFTQTRTPAYSQVVSASSFSAPHFIANGTTGLQYKIGEVDSNMLLKGQVYYCRISAFNSEGYGRSVVSGPVSATTAAMKAYMPDSVRIHVSYDDVPNHLDVFIDRSTANSDGYPELLTDSTEMPTAYRIEYDTEPTFTSGTGSTPLGYYDMPTIDTLGNPLTCAAGDSCYHPLGAEVQAVRVCELHAMECVG